jgi:hypothetical protein
MKRVAPGRNAERQTAPPPKPVQAYITIQRTYVVRCPRCHQSRQFRVAEIPAGRPDPFQYDCSACSATSMVQLIGFRSSNRRTARLTVSFTRARETPRLVRLGTALDISLSGMRLVTEPVDELGKGEILQLSVVLDDQVRSRLQLPATVRRLSKAGDLMEVAVQFLALKPEHRFILDRYIHHP